MERLQKIIADAGYCSRRKAEELIKNGNIRVNGELVKELGTKAGINDVITIDGQEIVKNQKEYYMLYKPRGVVSTTHDDKGRKTVIDFFPGVGRIYPIGRLDYDTTGILLLTNDGEFANLMMHPSSMIEKLYVAKISGILTGLEVKKLKTGILIEGVKVKADRVKVKKVDKITKTSIVEITIHEGKNHQVKKMFEQVGKEVLKLKRETYAFLTLGSLKPGEGRRLTPKEIKILYSIIKK